MTVRVLWLIKELEIGGAEALLRSFAWLRESPDLEAHVGYVGGVNSGLVADLVDAGVTVHGLGGCASADPRWMLALGRLLRQGRFDVVHSHSPLPGGIAKSLMRCPGLVPRCHMLSTEHGPWTSYAILSRLLHRATFRGDEVRIAVSEHVRRSLPTREGRRTTVLYHGAFDTRGLAHRRRERAEARRRLGLSHDDVAYVAVGNERPDKDYCTLFDAFEIVCRSARNVRLLIVGREGEMLSRVPRSAESGSLSRVSVLGCVSDVPGVLAACDVFCSSSRSEGLPISMIEGMAMGLPVVATSVGGIPELVRDGSDGVLVPRGDARSLAAGLLSLTNSHYRSELGRNCSLRAAQFDVKRAVQWQEMLYMSLVAPAGGRA